jgi:ParB-like chromosome segregation protein Spo0J
MVSTRLLEPHPENPRLGNVDAIAESFRAHGFYGVLVAQRSSNRVLAGNHRLLAARKVELSEVPVVWVDVDDDQARRILLTDNRTNDLATYDLGDLTALLSELAVTEDGLAGTGYEPADLDALLSENAPPAATVGEEPKQANSGREGINRYDHHDEWETSTRRTMVLDYSAEMFLWVQDCLREVGTARRLAVNAAIVVALLAEFTGRQPPDEDADG